MQISNYIPIMLDLLRTDIQLLSRTIKDKFIDLFIWIVTMVLVTAYLMPAFGLEKSYGLFMAAGLCASASLFEIFPSIVGMISDFEYAQTINYYLILPIPSWLVFVRSIISYAINAALISLPVLPLCKLLMWRDFDLSHFSLIKFAIIFLLTSMFTGAFTLLTISYIPSSERVGSVWMRLIYPMWFMGCFQFSWKVLYTIWPIFAYIDLINPMVYVMEGMRAAILGQEEYLSFWLCASMLIFFTLALSYIAIKRLKKRLNFV